MNDRKIERTQLTRNAAARREEIFEHEPERNFVRRIFIRQDEFETVGFFSFFEHH